jgi:hypothetical protein
MVRRYIEFCHDNPLSAVPPSGTGARSNISGLVINSPVTA